MFLEFLIGLILLFVLVWVYQLQRHRFVPRTTEERNDDKAQTATSLRHFRLFQWNFLVVYLIMMAADWVQGPYVYALYDYYGFSRADNGFLFIAGFGSSLVFGTWSGPLADTYGRKKACLLYGVTYTLSCVTKFFNHFPTLMAGRLLGGFATSILWSGFESWMVAEHHARGFEPALLSETFSMMTTGNGLVAILAGMAAQLVESYFEHLVAPFGLSATFLIVGSASILAFWGENYGDKGHAVCAQLADAAKKIKEDRRVFLVGAQQALFEGAMYTFVFLWTPAFDTTTALSSGGEKAQIPHGIIFACFMLACSSGSMLFGMVVAEQPPSSSVLLSRTISLMRVVYVLAAAAMAVPVVGLSEQWLVMAAFLVFEGCVGMFWPGIGTLRARFVPEVYRASIINIFRMPLNAIVCLMLYQQGVLSVANVFTFCVVLHTLAFAASCFLVYCVDLTIYPPSDRGM